MSITSSETYYQYETFFKIRLQSFIEIGPIHAVISANKDGRLRLPFPYDKII